MKESDLQRIRHIKSYCLDIAASLQRFGTEYEIFASDRDYQNSVSMSIMQIGELSVGLSDDFKAETRNKIQWSLIRGMRNMFAHAYISMNKEDIWDTAVNDIPVLLNFCERIIGNDEIFAEKNNIIATDGILPQTENAASKPKPTLAERLEEGKRKSAQHGQSGGSKSKKRGLDE